MDDSNLKNIPDEYKNLYEKLSPSAKSELNEQAKGVNGLDTLSGVRSFFQTRDFKSLSNMNALHKLNEDTGDGKKSGLSMITDLLNPYK